MGGSPLEKLNAQKNWQVPVFGAVQSIRKPRGVVRAWLIDPARGTRTSCPDTRQNSPKKIWA